MRHILSQASKAVLEGLAHTRTLCAFDFDGTLSPIVDHPDQAGMRARTRKLLACVAAAYPCVIVSGRARRDLIGKLGGIEVARAIGNHGAENGTHPRDIREEVERWRCRLAMDLEALPGMWVEDKG